MATPWPSGPVVASTPEVWPYSGWPGHLLPSWRKRWMSASGTAGSRCGLAIFRDGFHLRQMQERVKQHAGMPGGKNKAVAIGPKRVRGIVAQESLPHAVANRSERHGRSGMPGIGLLHGVHREGANGVDGKLLDLSRAHGISCRYLCPRSGKGELPPAARFPCVQQLLRTLVGCGCRAGCFTHESGYSRNFLLSLVVSLFAAQVRKRRRFLKRGYFPVRRSPEKPSTPRIHRNVQIKRRLRL